MKSRRTKNSPVAGDLYLAEQVRVEEDRRPARPEIADEIADQQPAERVEPRGWLVEKDQFWIVDERLRQAGALQHALAVLPQRTLGRIEQIHACEQVLDADVERDAAEPVQSSVEPQQLAAGQAVVKPEMFREEADARPRGAVADRRAQHGAASSGRRHERQEHLERRRLARAVGTEEAEDLTPVHRERQPLDRDLRAESLLQAARFDDRPAQSIHDSRFVIHDC